MLLKDNPNIYYKRENFHFMSFIIKAIILLIILALALSFIFFKPFIDVNSKAISLASNKEFVKRSVDIIDSRKAKLNKGDNYLVYDSQFFWNQRSSGVDFSNGYQQKFANIIMKQDRNSNKTQVIIKNIPDVSCSGFAEYIQEKHGTILIEKSSGGVDSCPSLFTSLLTHNKYNITYSID